MDDSFAAFIESVEAKLINLAPNDLLVLTLPPKVPIDRIDSFREFVSDLLARRFGSESRPLVIVLDHGGDMTKLDDLRAEQLVRALAHSYPGAFRKFLTEVFREPHDDDGHKTKLA